MTDPFAHQGSRKNLLGDTPAAGPRRAPLVEKQVTGSTPPAFIVHTAEDAWCRLENSLLFFQALRRPASRRDAPVREGPARLRH